MFQINLLSNLLIILFLLFSDLTDNSEIIYTKRNNNYLREGPASFYKLVEILPIGAKLKLLGKDDNWLHVQSPANKTGWVAKNCITEKEIDESLSEKLSKTWSSSKASKTGIAAAIKGFGRKTGQFKAGDVDLLLTLTENPVSTNEYQDFKKEISKTKSKNKNRVELKDLDLETPEYDPNLKEIQIGTGIASRLVSQGIVNNRELNQYVNSVCNLIVENSKMYDWTFSTLILEDNKVNGYACPGGYIFITKGALLNCSDEAELAGIIAHEMAHVIRKHGLQEMSQRSVQIKSDDIFAELEEDLDTEKDSVTEELENLIVNSYERIMHKRLINYEYEADKISSILCANAGYDPFGITRSAKRLYQLSAGTTDIFDDDYLIPAEIKVRHEKITDFTDDNYKKENAGAVMKERFMKYKSLLN